MNALNAYTPFLGMVLDQIDKMDEAKETFRDRVIKEWEESKKLPRKKKKAKRKELLLDWGIANWEPFEGYQVGIDLLRD